MGVNLSSSLACPRLCETAASILHLKIGQRPTICKLQKTCSMFVKKTKPAEFLWGKITKHGTRYSYCYFFFLNRVILAWTTSAYIESKSTQCTLVPHECSLNYVLEVLTLLFPEVMPGGPLPHWSLSYLTHSFRQAVLKPYFNLYFSCLFSKTVVL